MCSVINSGRASLYIIIINILIILGATIGSIAIENQFNKSSKLATMFLASKLVYPTLIGDKELIKQNIETFSFPSPLSKISVKGISNDFLYQRDTKESNWSAHSYHIENEPGSGKPIGELFVSYAFNAKPHIANILLSAFILLVVNFLIRRILQSKQKIFDRKETEAVKVIDDFVNKHYLDDEVLTDKDDTLSRSLRRLSSSLTNLERENTEKKYFIASMSHEIRNPLNAIIGMLRLALDNTSNPIKVREYLEDASDAASLLTKVISDVIDIAKIESGSLDICTEPFSLLDLLDSAVSIVEPSSNVDLSVHEENCRPFYVGDSIRIKQILVNILHNSTKHTQRGYISLSVSSTFTKNGVCNVCFKIKDTGTGIDKNILEHIFDPFVSHGQGTGLGLYITKTLVESMGGSIECQSTPGFGTETVIEIPLEYIDERTYFKSFHKESLSISEGNLKGFSVLVVEDNEINRKALYHLTRSWGMHCTAVSNGYEALELGSRHFDLILMDLNMPGLSGIEVTKSLRGNGVSTAIIAVTGNVLRGEAKRVKDAGFNGFIGKPFQPNILQRECLKALNPDSIQLETTALNNLELPGLSLREAQELYGNDDETLLKDLIYFKSKYSNVAETLEDFLGTEDIDAVIRLAHDLKTDAANVGAGEVYAIAVLLDDESLDLNTAATLISSMKRKLPRVIDSATSAIIHLKNECLN